MLIADLPQNEEQRLEALRSYKILDTLPEEEYDSITKIAAEICDTPIALVSLIDAKRQWFKSRYGLNVTETPRDFAFCAHSILEPNELFIIPDATKDPRFFDNPLTTDIPNVVFYVGAPLITQEGYALGTLCVIDNKPRNTITDGQQESLLALSKQVVSKFNLRKKNIYLEQKNKEITRLNNDLSQFAYRLSHDLKTHLRGISHLAHFIKEEFKGLNTYNEQIYEWVNLIASKSCYVESMVEKILNYTKSTQSNIQAESLNLCLKVL